MFYIKVKVVTDAKKESVQKKSETAFQIEVKEPAERNLANKRVLELIARHFNIPQNAVHIVTGHHRPNKLLHIEK